MNAMRFTAEIERLGIPLPTVKACLVKSVGSLLGETPRDATVYHIKLNECDRVEHVAARLILIFGEGATRLLEATLKECEKF